MFSPFVLIHPGLSVQQRRFTVPDSVCFTGFKPSIEVMGRQEEDLSTSSLLSEFHQDKHPEGVVPKKGLRVEYSSADPVNCNYVCVCVIKEVSSAHQSCFICSKIL